MTESNVIARLRRWLLVILVTGIVGVSTELALIGHFESITQRIPLVLLAAALLVSLAHFARPGIGTARALQALMILFVAAGAVGVGLHYDGNEEFEREMYPTMDGLELVRNTLTGATPVLAPGSMTLLGLVGLAHTYRHPSLVPHTGGARASEETS